MTPFSTPAPAPNARALAEMHGLGYVNLRRLSIDKQALEAIPLPVLERFQAVPYAFENGTLHVALADPSDLQLVDDLRSVSPHPIKFSVAAAADIAFELRNLARSNEVHQRSEFLDELPTEEGDLTAADGVSDAPPIRLVNSIILQAAEEGASDVHFLPKSDALVARIRIDGVLTEVERIPKRVASGVITRIKVLAKLDITEHRLAQDGRFTLRLKTGRVLDVRVAVLPTVGGEGVIMRLLDKSRKPPTLTEIGLSKEMQMSLEGIIHRPYGCFLVTGSTGSGKTTTIYSALADVIRPEVNVIAVEDPVEYRMEDVYQVQVDTAHGVSFPTALRSILRCDPDLLVVGEIRDFETARIVLEAALTGHAVFSSLHTNDAPGALARLIDLGIDPYVIGTSITGVLGQRLVRRLCDERKEPFTAEPELLAQLRIPAESISPDATFYRRRGCTRCTNGYRGRVGVFELMVMNAEMRRLVGARAEVDELARAARDAGMRSMWEDGIAKAARGLTTFEELSRVLG
jgi:type IV pilus assembly protein PilB